MSAEHGQQPGAAAGPAGAAEPPARRVPPFSPQALVRELRVDTGLRLAVVAAVITVLTAAFYFQAKGSILPLLTVVLAVGAWMLLNALSARVSAALPQITALIEADPAAAEDRIAEQLHRRPLLRWVRLMVYHRLAMLRHRQQRFAETAAICQALLMYPRGPSRDNRAHLLLMLAESRLECRDVAGAYAALLGLTQMKLSLIEHLHRLTLQTRYEVTIGANRAALRGARRKIQLIELLPAPQSGAVHAMLATAASRAEQTKLARWLWQRVELLCAPEQVNQLRRGGFGFGGAGPLAPTGLLD